MEASYLSSQRNNLIILKQYEETKKAHDSQIDTWKTPLKVEYSLFDFLPYYSYV